MFAFTVFRPVLTRLRDTYFAVEMKPVGSIRAQSPEHALEVAKASGYVAPIVAPELN